MRFLNQSSSRVTVHQGGYTATLDPGERAVLDSEDRRYTVTNHGKGTISLDDVEREVIFRDVGMKQVPPMQAASYETTPEPAAWTPCERWDLDDFNAPTFRPHPDD